jgi:hypothetical protein
MRLFPWVGTGWSHALATTLKPASSLAVCGQRVVLKLGLDDTPSDPPTTQLVGSAKLQPGDTTPAFYGAHARGAVRACPPADIPAHRTDRLAELRLVVHAGSDGSAHPRRSGLFQWMAFACHPSRFPRFISGCRLLSVVAAHARVAKPAAAYSTDHVLAVTFDSCWNFSTFRLTYYRWKGSPGFQSGSLS